MTTRQPFYSPALRLKEGELNGLRDLAPDVAGLVLPRMIVPPPGERDDKQIPLLIGEMVPDFGTSLAANWQHRAFIDSTYILDEFGRDRAKVWLPKMFERAQKAGAKAIPLVGYVDLLSDETMLYSGIVDRSAPLAFGVVVPSGYLGTMEPLLQILAVLAKLGISPEQCAIIADFHDADFSQPNIVAPIISGVMETLQLSAPWHQIIFQGTNYPEKNPAEAGSAIIVQRNEWISWRQAVKFDPQTAEHMIFGDYAADCAKMSFGPSGGRAICHFRYTVPDGWLVQRGAAAGKQEIVMQDVAKGIINSGLFAGREFSSADNAIYLLANGQVGPGKATNWRAINTTHHITRVVNDVGLVRGVAFDKKRTEPLSQQRDFFALIK